MKQMGVGFILAGLLVLLIQFLGLSPFSGGTTACARPGSADDGRLCSLCFPGSGTSGGH